MNYLAIDTSGKNLTVIVEYNGVVKEYYDDLCGVHHSVALMPKIEELKEELNADFRNLDFIAVVIGAGSFTGIRIGVATAKALCFAYNVKALSITSFDTIYYSKGNGKYLSIIDAKHNSFYVCGYNDKEIIVNPKFIDKTELEDLAKEYRLISSDTLNGFNAEKADLLVGLKNAVKEKRAEATCDLNSIAPLYIRKSQAEENR